MTYQNFNISRPQIIAIFKRVYLSQNNKEFKLKNGNSDEPNIYLNTLILYMLKDKKFFDSPIITNKSVPDFNKGLLTIGGYGNGKSSIWNALIRTFEIIIDKVEKDYHSNKDDIINQFTINKVTSTEIVENYNVATKGDLKDLFRPLKSIRQLYIDDIMAEPDAYNFGKNNIFLSVLKNRADKGFITHLTLNYSIDENKNFKNLDETLFDFSTRYNGRVYDRIFGNYNIIELKGKSLRK